MTIAGIDLGSAWLGLVLAADELPLRLVAEPRTLGVDPRDLDVVVSVVVATCRANGVTRAALEHGRLYPPDMRKLTPQQVAAAMAAIGRNHEVCTRLDERLTRALVADGVEVVTVARQTWAHALVPHHQGSISEAKGNEAIRGRCAPGTWELLGAHAKDPQHERDAAGVLLGAWLVNREPRRRHHKYRDRRKDKTKPRPVDLAPEQRKAKRMAYQLDWQRTKRGTEPLEDLAAAGCLCFVDRERRAGRHKEGCPKAPTPTVHGDIAAAIARGPYLR